MSKMVSICCITYNQENYIGQALEGMLMQETNFEVEIIIGEDCSTDATKAIIENYQRQHPGKIQLLTRAGNLGVRKNFESSLLACTGKYIAICEGDDYWTDPKKLQKQVDYLEANKDCILCFHASDIYSQDTGTFKPANDEQQPLVTNMYDLIDHWYIMTGSMMFRNTITQFPTWFTKLFNTDYALQLLLMGNGGTIGYLPQTMSVYRKHNQGESARTWGADPYFWLMYLFDEIDAHFNKKYHAQINTRKKQIVATLASYFKGQLLNKQIGYSDRLKNMIRFIFMKFNYPDPYYRKFLRLKKFR